MAFRTRVIQIGILAAMTMTSAVSAQDLTGLLDPPPSVGDLPPAALEPSETLNICDGLGEGYMLIPGTQTCLRIRAGVQTDFNVDVRLGGSSSQSRSTSRGRLGATTVTGTAFGPLRTHVGVGVN